MIMWDAMREHDDVDEGARTDAEDWTCHACAENWPRAMSFFFQMEFIEDEE